MEEKYIQNQRQENFNKAYIALMKQGKLSIEPWMSVTKCVYIQQDGTRCAIGHLIPDDIIKSLSYADCCSSDVYHMLQKFGVPDEQRDKVAFLVNDDEFYNDLQSLHDDLFHIGNYDEVEKITKDKFRERFGHSARIFASKWKLTVPEVDLVD